MLQVFAVCKMAPKITLMFNQSWDVSYCTMVLLLFELGNYVATNVECVGPRKSRFFFFWCFLIFTKHAGRKYFRSYLLTVTEN